MTIKITNEEILTKCKPFTMTSLDRQRQILEIVEYTIRENVEGDIIEIGV